MSRKVGWKTSQAAMLLKTYKHLNLSPPALEIVFVHREYNSDTLLIAMLTVLLASLCPKSGWLYPI